MSLIDAEMRRLPTTTPGQVRKRIGEERAMIGTKAGDVVKTRLQVDSIVGHNRVVLQRAWDSLQKTENAVAILAAESMANLVAAPEAKTFEKDYKSILSPLRTVDSKTLFYCLTYIAALLEGMVLKPEFAKFVEECRIKDKIAGINAKNEKVRTDAFREEDPPSNPGPRLEKFRKAVQQETKPAEVPKTQPEPAKPLGLVERAFERRRRGNN